MSTVFSHIVQKRLSRENENVATEALAYILGNSEAARNGMMKLLCGVAKMPDLRFRTQQTDGNSRPDMHGCDDDGIPRVFVENKFWAGLTEKQPVSYLRALATRKQPTILVVVGPEERKEELWRLVNERLRNETIVATQETVAGIFRTVTTNIGPILALTSWKSLLDALWAEVADDKSARSDLVQLQALCEAADIDADPPISSEETSDQRTPARILQFSRIWESAVEIAVTEHVLNLKGTTRQAAAERIGRYAYFGANRNAGLWLGIHFELWKKHGKTPLWAVFSSGEWGRADEVRALLEPWAARKRIFATNHDNGSFVLSLDVKHGATKDEVVTGIVVRLKEIADALAALKSKPPGNAPNE